MPDNPATVKARISYNDSPLDVELPVNVYGEGRCPECGQPVESADHARKHAITHYGAAVIPQNAGTLLARARRAALLGEDMPER